MENKRPSKFTLKYQVPIKDEHYKFLRRFVAGEQGISVMVIGAKFMDFLPESFNVPDESIYLMILSIASAFVSTIFFVGKEISRGNYMISYRLAVISVFLLAYGIFAIIPDSFHFRFLVFVIPFVVIALLFCWQIWETKNCFRENIGFGFYCLGLNLFFFFSILIIPIYWLI